MPNLEIHHVEEHSKGGQTTLENAALVHRKDCHPKGAEATADFAKKWAALKAGVQPITTSVPPSQDTTDDDDEGYEAGAKSAG